MSFDLVQFNKAIIFAVRIHARQTRRNGDPYITHPMRVAGLLLRAGIPDDMNPLRDKMAAAAILHDVVEDDPEKKPVEMKARLHLEFGAFITNLVEELTQDLSLPYEERRKKMIDECGAKSLHAQIIKLCDRIDNLTDLQSENAPVKLRDRYLVETPIMIKNMQAGCNACPELFNRIKTILYDLRTDQILEKSGE